MTPADMSIRHAATKIIARLTADEVPEDPKVHGSTIDRRRQDRRIVLAHAKAMAAWSADRWHRDVASPVQEAAAPVAASIIDELAPIVAADPWGFDGSAWSSEASASVLDAIESFLQETT